MASSAFLIIARVVGADDSRCRASPTTHGAHVGTTAVLYTNGALGRAPDSCIGARIKADEAIKVVIDMAQAMPTRSPRPRRDLPARTKSRKRAGLKTLLKSLRSATTVPHHVPLYASPSAYPQQPRLPTAGPPHAARPRRTRSTSTQSAARRHARVAPTEPPLSAGRAAVRCALLHVRAARPPPTPLDGSQRRSLPTHGGPTFDDALCAARVLVTIGAPNTRAPDISPCPAVPYYAPPPKESAVSMEREVFVGPKPHTRNYFAHVFDSVRK